MGSVEKIISSVESVFDVLTSITKIGMVTDIPIEENLSGDKEVNFDQGIHIKLTDVTLREDSYVFLNGMNLEINNAEKICIVGNVNAGKTVLLQLLAGWYDHYEGNIQFNNVSLKDLNLTRLRRQIGDCMSTEGIFQGTMEENIMVGYPGANFTDLQAATNHSGLSEFMFGLSGGFTKMLYPEDKTLPKSVKQQVLWARGIIGPKSLILWEDIYGMVSFQEKMNLIGYLTNEENNQTVILVSNDMHIISKCTRIIGLEKGKILYDIAPTEINKHDWFNEICINKNA